MNSNSPYLLKFHMAPEDDNFLERYEKVKNNKTYYVRVRAYKLDSASKRVYGKYSKMKKVKLKK